MSIWVDIKSLGFDHVNLEHEIIFIVKTIVFITIIEPSKIGQSVIHLVFFCDCYTIGRLFIN